MDYGGKVFAVGEQFTEGQVVVEEGFVTFVSEGKDACEIDHARSVGMLKPYSGLMCVHEIAAE